MADRKITDLTALAAGSQATGDLLTIVDVSEGAAADKNKKITVESLFKGIPGNVGIGTTSPQRALVVSDAGAEGFEFFPGSSDTGNTLNHYDRGSSAFIDITTNADKHIFGRADGEKMRIDSSGRLLVGTSSAHSDTDLVEFEAAAANASQDVLIINGGQTSFSGTNDANTAQSIRFKACAYNANDGIQELDTARIKFEKTNSWNTGSSASAVNGKLIFEVASGTSASTTLTERMRIDSSGKIDVPAGIGPQIRFENQHSNTADAVISTFDDGAGTLLCLGSNFYFSGAGAETRYNTSEESAGILLNRTGVISFLTNGTSATATERMRIDSSGRLLVGTPSGTLSNASVVIRGNPAASGVEGNIQLSRDGAPSATTQSIGQIFFTDNSSNIGAQISAFCDGTWTSGSSHPTRLVFSTTAGSASSPTERMRITQQGYAKFSPDGTYQSAIGTWHEFSGTTNGTQVFILKNRGASFAYRIQDLNAVRAATSSYSFIRCFSGNYSDTEFNLRGDGNAYADSSWNGGGADYAEYFEWSDGNSTAEDRRGISVVLDGDKIREAVAGEEPIGVISGNPSVVGDADFDRWKGKYLRDDYGTYVEEDYEVENEDGNTVVQQRRKLNPDYNPDTEYVSREDRPEWDTVGLMGKLRIRKGQVTGTRWIKMRDVSDTVEEWLVR